MLHVSDVPYTPIHTDKQLASLRNMAYAAKKGRTIEVSWRRPATYIVYESDHLFTSMIGAVCHRNIKYNSIAKPVLVWTDISSTLRRDLVEPFVKWFVQESWASRFILNGDDLDDVMTNGIFVSAGLCAPLLQNIMILSRHSIECSGQSFEMFNKLINEGVLASVAYSLCFNTSFSTCVLDPASETTLNYPVVTKHGHRVQGLLPLDSYVQQEQQILFKAEAPKWVTTPYSDNNDYDGGCTIFDSGQLNAYGSFIKENFIHNIFVKPEWKELLARHRQNKNNSAHYSPPNPFKRGNKDPQVSSNQISYEELYNVFSYLLSDYVKEQLQVEERKVA